MPWTGVHFELQKSISESSISQGVFVNQALSVILPCQVVMTAISQMKLIRSGIGHILQVIGVEKFENGQPGIERVIPKGVV